MLTLTTSTSHIQSCFKIDLTFIKLSNGSFVCLKARVFLVTIMKWRISGQGYKHLTEKISGPEVSRGGGGGMVNGQIEKFQ